MQIRKKLTFQFLSIVAFIFIISSITIYYFSASFRENEFYSRLENKAEGTARLLIEINEVDSTLLRLIDYNIRGSLPHERIVIYNYKDQVLYNTDDGDKLQITKEMLDKVRLNKAVRFRQGDFEIIGILYIDKYNRFVAFAGAIDNFGLSKLQNLRTVIIVVFFISFFITYLTGWLYSGQFVRPIMRVIKQVEKITASNLNSRVDEGENKDEISILAHTFNKMLERVESAFIMQKEFVSNASHELRTPLTAITGQLEVALINKKQEKSYEKIILSVLDDIKNLNLLSNRLLSLAQASSEGIEMRFLPLRIDELIWHTRLDLIRINMDFKVEIYFEDFPDDEEKLIVNGNEKLLNTAIINLLENGCKFSKDNTVRLHIGVKDNNLMLRFVDQGIGIRPEDLDKVLQPFYRGQNTISIKGHGIGLSLVHKIIKLHNGTLNIESELGQGSTFTITIPHS